MDISLRQLETFVKVVEHRSFSRAGDELFLSQSTVSSHIAQLEQTLGATLILRSEKKNIEVTDEGLAAFHSAQQVLEQARSLQNMFHKEIKDQPLLSIAASTVPSSYILPELMAGFSRQHPECRFSILDGDSAFALERLQNGEAAFAFVGTLGRAETLRHHTVCRDRMVLITANAPEFTAKKEAGTPGRELLDCPMIMRESGSGTRRETDAYLKRIGRSVSDLNVAVYMNNIEGIKSMVASGRGVTILSERAARDAIETGRVLGFELEQDGPYRDICITYLKNRRLTKTEQAFLNFVKKSTIEN